MLILIPAGWTELKSGPYIAQADIRLRPIVRKNDIFTWIVDSSEEYGLIPKDIKIDIVNSNRPGVSIETIGGRVLTDISEDTLVCTTEGPKKVGELQTKDKLIVSLNKTPTASEKNSTEWIAGFKDGKEISKLKECSNNILDKDLQYKMGYIVGFAEDNGHIDFNEKSRSLSVRITFRNKEVLQRVSLILQELGYFSKIYAMNHNCSRLVIGGLKNAKTFIQNSTLKNEKFDKAIASLSEAFATRPVDEVSVITNSDVSKSIVFSSPGQSAIVNGLILLG